MVSLKGGSAFIGHSESENKSKLTSETHHKDNSSLFKVNFLLRTVKLSLWAALGWT